MKKPLLLVEALAVRNDSGLGNMARLYVDALRGLSADAEIRVLLPKSSAYEPGGHCEPIRVQPKPLRAWTQFGFPFLIARHRPRAVFCLGQTLPFLRPSAHYALAVPDAGPLEDLGWATSSHDPYNRRWLKRMAPRADRIVTLSAFSKDRLAHLLGIPKGRISIVRPIPRTRGGEAAKGSPAAAAAKPRGSIGADSGVTRMLLDGPFFLALGNVEPRKNFPGLISAYALLKGRCPDLPPLIIAGHKAWGFAEAEAAVARHGLSSHVRFAGHVSDAEASALMRDCTVFISSSLYEGWGLPLYEALAQGKPSIYHRDSSQEEFARGLALATDCSDAAQLADAIESLWSNESGREAYRNALAQSFGAIAAYDVEAALREALLPLLQG